MNEHDNLEIKIKKYVLAELSRIIIKKIFYPEYYEDQEIKLKNFWNYLAPQDLIPFIKDEGFKLSKESPTAIIYIEDYIEDDNSLYINIDIPLKDIDNVYGFSFIIYFDIPTLKFDKQVPYEIVD